MCSLKELGGLVAVDLDHEVSEAAGTVHHALTRDFVHSSDVISGEGLVVNVTRVDIGCGYVETFLGPLHEVTVEEHLGVSGVLSVDRCGLSFVPEPVFIR